MYFDLQQVLSYNALINIIVGERGVGKTYSCKKFCIRDFIKNGNQFVYLRRYETELKESCDGFFDGLIKNKEFEGTEFGVIRKKKTTIFTCDGEVMGFGMSLSVASQFKSKEFPNVKNLVFDEFIIDKGVYRYLKNEVHCFLDICESLFRLRDFRAFLLGNAISQVNPYFNYFKINMPYGSTITTSKEGEILMCYVKNEVYRDVKRKTRFGKLIDGTEYGKYAIDNMWLRESKSFIEKRPEKAKFYFTLQYQTYTFGIWADGETSKIYISNSYDPSCPIIFTLSADDHNEKTRLISMRRSDFFKNLLEHYRLGLLCFESVKIKAILIDVINQYAT
ncbi:MAG: phage DNA encapsidation protein [Methanobrevibacter sp.]|nr:phage DNA encapsidation protein [Methanobrevibacter sp.]